MGAKSSKAKEKLLEASKARHDKARHDQLLGELEIEHNQALQEKEDELKKLMIKMQNENCSAEQS